MLKRVFAYIFMPKKNNWRYDIDFQHLLLFYRFLFSDVWTEMDHKILEWSNFHISLDTEPANVYS